MSGSRKVEGLSESQPWDTPSGWGGASNLKEKDALILDVFPENPNEDMGALESEIRGLSIPNVKWGEQFKVEPVAFGINKITCQCIIDGGKVETQDVQDRLVGLRRGERKLIKSADFVAFTKC